MGNPVDLIEAPLDRTKLRQRWRAMLVDPGLADVPGKIELTDWGEMLMSPVGKTHGLLATRIARLLDDALSGRCMVEVGVLTSLGVRAPDVAWCSENFLATHVEEAPLDAAPELCVEIASGSNALPKLRDKARAYVEAGAREAWSVFPATNSVEIYGADGLRASTVFTVNPSVMFS